MSFTNLKEALYPWWEFKCVLHLTKQSDEILFRGSAWSWYLFWSFFIVLKQLVKPFLLASCCSGLPLWVGYFKFTRVLLFDVFNGCHGQGVWRGVGEGGARWAWAGLGFWQLLSAFGLSRGDWALACAHTYICGFWPFGNLWHNLSTKCVILDIKYRFTYGDSDLSETIKKCQNIMTRVVI